MPQPTQRLPSTSTRRPSGVPGPASISVRLLARRLPPTTSKTWMRRGDHARLHDVEARLVGREGEPVRAVDVAAHDGQAPARRIHAIDVGRQLRRGAMSLVEAEHAEGRVGEPDRPVRPAHDVVGRVERLAVVAVGDHRDRPVVFGARDPPRVVLAGEEPALPVARVAVGVVRRLAEHADRARLLLPLEDPVVGDVAPEEVAPVAEPGRSFRPAKAGSQPLDLGQLDAVLREARVEDPDGGIGIALARLPVGADARRRRRRGRRRSRTGGEELAPRGAIRPPRPRRGSAP